MENPEVNSRITKWITEIRPLRVTFKPRATIKGQVLADFIAEFTPGPPPQNDSLKGLILNVDGASNDKGAGVGVVLTTQIGPSSSSLTRLGSEPIMRPSTKQSFQASR